MFIPVEKSRDKTKNYEKLLDTIPYYIDKSDPWFTTLSNAAALIDYFLADVNWVGFYITKEDTLFLGPFQGRPACTRIRFGQGVCGTAAAEKKTLSVDDVDAFPGHIACDSDSKSEIVVPIVKGGTVFGVLDIDSPLEGRFDETDQAWLEKLVGLIVDNLS